MSEKEYYVYIFGEADGSFKCEHRDKKGVSDCHKRTWHIFTESQMESRRALCAGIALCKEHEPDTYKGGTNCMATVALLTTNQTNRGDEG